MTDMPILAALVPVVVLLALGITTAIGSRALGLSPIVGYIALGIGLKAVGVRMVFEEATISLLAALGVVFLLFDVEVVFLWPWAPLFHRAAVTPNENFLGAGFGKDFLLVEMVVFILVLTLGLVYAWRKGVLRWA